MKAVRVHEYEKVPSIADLARNDAWPATNPAGHDLVLRHGGRFTAPTPHVVPGHTVGWSLDRALAILVP